MSFFFCIFVVSFKISANVSHNFFYFQFYVSQIKDKFNGQIKSIKWNREKNTDGVLVSDKESSYQGMISRPGVQPSVPMFRVGLDTTGLSWPFWKKLRMTGFKHGSSGVGSDPSANWAATTKLLYTFAHSVDTFPQFYYFYASVFLLPVWSHYFYCFRSTQHNLHLH